MLFTCFQGAFPELGLETVTLRGGRFSRRLLTEASGSCIGIGHVGAPGRGDGDGDGDGGGGGDGEGEGEGKQWVAVVFIRRQQREKRTIS